MSFKLTFCQQVGNKQKKNQDALFNGKNVYQWQLKNAESDILKGEKVIFGVADGVSSHSKSHCISRFLMEQLAQCEALNTAWLRTAYTQLCEQFAQTHLGASSTFVACELSANGKGRIVNVGDSRAYKITANNQWQQLSCDHTVLSEMKQQGLVNEKTDYASIYNGLTDCLVADFAADDFRIHVTEFQLKKGECILLCSDGLNDVISQLEYLWPRAFNRKLALDICRKIVKKHRLYDDLSVVACERM